MSPRTEADQRSEDWIEPGDEPGMVAEVEQRFLAAFGRRPDHLCRAPGRVNLIGEHTDYNRGLCLPIAIPHSTFAAVGARTDGMLRLASTLRPGVVQVGVDSLEPGSVSGWAAYAAGVVWAAREAGWPVPRLDLLVHGTVPLGAGLSSSAALECAVALSLSEVLGLVLDDDLRRRWVEICMRAEREMAGAPTGGLDQTASLLARVGHAQLLDFADGSRVQVPWDPERYGVELLVVDTRATHSLSDGGYGSRRAECQAAAAALGVDSLRAATTESVAAADLPPTLRRRAGHVVTEIARVSEAVAAIQRGDLAALGAIFDASHASLRDDFEVSCSELDAVCAAAGRAGALGARMTGGGFGGSAIVLAPRERVDRIRAEIQRSFLDNGWPAPGFLRAPASAGARRVEP